MNSSIHRSILLVSLFPPRLGPPKVPYMAQKRLKLFIGLSDRAPWGPFWVFNWIRQRAYPDYYYTQLGFDQNWARDPWWTLLIQAGRATLSLKRA